MTTSLINRMETYFSRISEKYPSHYSKGRNTLHSLRLDLALKGDQLAGKSILDVGAGTGALYDVVHDKGISGYRAIDISSDMLKRSSIPEESRTCSSFEGLRLERKFDRIYALGLHTYLDNDQEDELWRFITSQLSEQGRAVVSFTNRQCFWNHLRSGAKKMLSGISLLPDYPPVRMTSIADLDVPGLDRRDIVCFNPIIDFLPSYTYDKQNALLYTDLLATFSLSR